VQPIAALLRLRRVVEEQARADALRILGETALIDLGASQALGFGERGERLGIGARYPNTPAQKVASACGSSA